MDDELKEVNDTYYRLTSDLLLSGVDPIIIAGVMSASGMKLYKTTALNRSGTDIATISGTSNAFFCMGGHMSACATASHIAKTEVVRDPDSFSDVIRGLHVYGGKVLRPEAITRTAVVLT